MSCMSLVGYEVVCCILGIPLLLMLVVVKLVFVDGFVVCLGKQGLDGLCSATLWLPILL